MKAKPGKRKFPISKSGITVAKTYGPLLKSVKQFEKSLTTRGFGGLTFKELTDLSLLLLKCREIDLRLILSGSKNYPTSWKAKELKSIKNFLNSSESVRKI
jgi:hypothetical protein